MLLIRVTFTCSCLYFLFVLMRNCRNGYLLHDRYIGPDVIAEPLRLLSSQFTKFIPCSTPSACILMHHFIGATGTGKCMWFGTKRRTHSYYIAHRFFQRIIVMRVPSGLRHCCCCMGYRFRSSIHTCCASSGINKNGLIQNFFVCQLLSICNKNLPEIFPVYISFLFKYITNAFHSSSCCCYVNAMEHWLSSGFEPCSSCSQHDVLPHKLKTTGLKTSRMVCGKLLTQLVSSRMHYAIVCILRAVLLFIFMLSIFDESHYCLYNHYHY